MNEYEYERLKEMDTSNMSLYELREHLAKLRTYSKQMEEDRMQRLNNEQMTSEEKILELQNKIDLKMIVDSMKRRGLDVEGLPYEEMAKRLCMGYYKKKE